MVLKRIIGNEKGVKGRKKTKKKKKKGNNKTRK